MGLSTFRVSPAPQPTPALAASKPDLDGAVLQNQYLKLHISGATGLLTHVTNKERNVTTALSQSLMW